MTPPPTSTVVSFAMRFTSTMLALGFMSMTSGTVYGLPPDPVVPTRDLPNMWRYAGLAASAFLAAAVSAFARRG